MWACWYHTVFINKISCGFLFSIQTILSVGSAHMSPSLPRSLLGTDFLAAISLFNCQDNLILWKEHRSYFRALTTLCHMMRQVRGIHYFLCIPNSWHSVSDVMGAFSTKIFKRKGITPLKLR